MSIRIDTDQKLENLRKSILDTPIEVDLTEQIMKNLDQEKEVYYPINSKKSWKFKTLTAIGSSVAIIFLLLATSMASPALASTLNQIPILGSVFQMAGDLGLKTADQKGFYNQLDTSDTHDGLTVKASAVTYDGTRVSVAIESTDTKKHKKLTDSIDNIHLKINGENVKSYFAAEDNNIGVFVFPALNKDSLILEFGDLKNQGGRSFPDHFDATLDITVNGIQEPFKLNMPVQLNTDTNQIIKPNIQKTFEGITFKLNQIEITPITTNVTTEISIPTSMPDFKKKFGYEVLDNQGNKLETIYGNGWNSKEVDDNKILISDTKFEPFKNLSKSITIKPFVYLYQDNSTTFKTDSNGNLSVEYIPELEMTLPVNRK